MALITTPDCSPFSYDDDILSLSKSIVDRLTLHVKNFGSLCRCDTQLYYVSDYHIGSDKNMCAVIVVNLTVAFSGSLGQNANATWTAPAGTVSGLRSIAYKMMFYGGHCVFEGPPMVTGGSSRWFAYADPEFIDKLMYWVAAALVPPGQRNFTDLSDADSCVHWATWLDNAFTGFGSVDSQLFIDFVAEFCRLYDIRGSLCGKLPDYAAKDSNLDSALWISPLSSK